MNPSHYTDTPPPNSAQRIRKRKHAPSASTPARPQPPFNPYHPQHHHGPPGPGGGGPGYPPAMNPSHAHGPLGLNLPPSIHDDLPDNILDDLDRLTPRDLAVARYIRNHEMLSIIFDARRIDTMQPAPSPYSAMSASELSTRVEKLNDELKQLSDRHTRKLQRLNAVLSGKAAVDSAVLADDDDDDDNTAAPAADQRRDGDDDDDVVDAQWAQNPSRGRIVGLGFVRAETPPELRAKSQAKAVDGARIAAEAEAKQRDQAERQKQQQQTSTDHRDVKMGDAAAAPTSAATRKEGEEDGEMARQLAEMEAIEQLNRAHGVTVELPPMPTPPPAPVTAPASSTPTPAAAAVPPPPPAAAAAAPAAVAAPSQPPPPTPSAPVQAPAELPAPAAQQEEAKRDPPAAAGSGSESAAQSESQEKDATGAAGDGDVTMSESVPAAGEAVPTADAEGAPTTTTTTTTQQTGAAAPVGEPATAPSSDAVPSQPKGEAGGQPTASASSST